MLKPKLLSEKSLKRQVNILKFFGLSVLLIGLWSCSNHYTLPEMPANLKQPVPQATPPENKTGEALTKALIEAVSLGNQCYYQHQSIVSFYDQVRKEANKK